MSAFTASRRQSRLWLPLRLALRELRGGLRGFLVFIACIALGVMTIAAVGSFARSLTEGLAREGRSILGGDIAFQLVQRETTPVEHSFLASRGRFSAAATLRGMARSSAGASALVEMKAVDDAYPLYGTIALEPAVPLRAALAERDGAYGAAVEPGLLARLGLSIGERLTVGDATFEIRAVIRSEPDKLSDGIAFGPRLLVSIQGLRATGLLQPGSLVRWSYRLALPAGAASDYAIEALRADAQAKIPDAGWEVRSRTNAAPRLERNIDRFTQFLTLVGLTALLVGGVGVANAVRSYVDRKQEVIATMKALGATGARVVTLYTVQVLLLAAIGVAIGLAVGAALPFAIAAAFGTIIPLPLAPALHGDELALAAAYGFLTALAFAIWPLGRAHDVPVSALFRDSVSHERARPRSAYMIAMAIVVAALAATALFAAYDRRIAIIFIVAASAVLVALRLIAALLMAVARKLPRARSTVIRLAVNNIHRPGALTPTIVLSLGLGLALLVTVALIEGNLRRQFQSALPERAPAFYFVDIQQGQTDAFLSALRTEAPAAEIEQVPMLRGRIVAVNGRLAEELNPNPQTAWALRGDRGITYSVHLPEGSRLAAGAWWSPDYAGPPLVSLEKRIAEGLGLAIGDTITVNVLGRNITAQVANLRTVDWQSLGINFVLVFSPGSFRGAPYTSIATLTYPAGAGGEQEESALAKAVADRFPSVTTVRMREALESIGTLVGNLVVAVRSASLLSILSAILVLGAALGASHRQRVYEAVVLKTLGATRRQLVSAYALEYLALGAATALFGVAAGSVAAWFVVSDLMNLRFVWLPGPAFAAAGGALVLTVGLGLIGTLKALGQKAAPVLRNL